MIDFPAITTDVIELVEEVRAAQKGYFELATGKDAGRNRHAITRALQRAKVAEAKLDGWLIQYRKDEAAWVKWHEAKKHSEQLAMYDVTHGATEEQESGE